MPKIQPAFSYPAHDHHGQENVTVAIDPYDRPGKANLFVVNYRDHDLMPIFLVITNDGESPIEIGEMQAELVTASRAKLSPATQDDILRRISHPHASATRSPLPFPSKKVKGAVGSAEREEIENAQFKAKAVEPRSSQAGFLFFDVSDVDSPLAGAEFYLTGLRDGAGHELMYFEVPLDKYLEAK
ncbi:MAG: hypothetical protein JO356_09970 [Acidobacteria bacterium]|nr:hypothetical protein [Acidobacteriota bacterium]